MSAQQDRSFAVNRRSFLKSVAAGAAGGALAGSHVRAGAAGVAGHEPLGMLAARLQMSRRRLTGGGTPAYTKEFVLADVALSPPRRFNEFSGDLSGRYIGALACDVGVPPHSTDAVVPAIVAHQRADGRFGSESLVFTADAIGPPHMALLWGNGRLLVGLLEHWERTHSAAVLASARRLADFLVNVRQQCADPGVAARVEGQGAFGFICFTQLIEGLVLTANATGNRKYLETSAEIAPLLPSRGIQHSHGYLSTLRGVVLLYDATKDARWLEFAKSRFDDLVRSKDHTVYGAVLEYFGWEAEGVTEAERKHLLAASGDHARDEGCSSADFVRLALQLWSATGEALYLDRAEEALENSLYPNQWETGDFGSRVTFDRGLMPTANAARCWWCCTMHGHRALADVLSSTVVRRGDALVVTLLGDARWSDGVSELAASREIAPDGAIAWHVDATGLRPGQALLVRQPAWTRGAPAVTGAAVAGSAAAPGTIGLVVPTHGRLSATIAFTPVTRLVRRDGTSVALDALGATPVEGALFHGPWLLAADEAREPLFLGEPWPENVVHLPASARATLEPGPRTPGDISGLGISATYEHGGFGGLQPVRLGVLSAQTRGAQRTMAAWLRYRHA
jgi:DUF1680 family protein